MTRKKPTEVTGCFCRESREACMCNVHSPLSSRQLGLSFFCSWGYSSTCISLYLYKQLSFVLSEHLDLWAALVWLGSKKHRHQNYQIYQNHHHQYNHQICQHQQNHQIQNLQRLPRPSLQSAHTKVYTVYSLWIFSLRKKFWSLNFWHLPFIRTSRSIWCYNWW